MPLVKTAVPPVTDASSSFVKRTEVVLLDGAFSERTKPEPLAPLVLWISE